MMTRDFHDNRLSQLLAGFKKHIRITSDEQDAMLMTYLKAAVLNAEHYIGQVIAVSTFIQIEVLRGSLVLHGPVKSINSISVCNVELPTDAYELHKNTLSVSELYHGREASISYVAGFEKIPYDITAAIYMMAADLYMNPVDTVRNLNTASKNLLNPYRTWGHDR